MDFQRTFLEPLLNCIFNFRNSVVKSRLLTSRSIQSHEISANKIKTVKGSSCPVCPTLLPPLLQQHKARFPVHWYTGRHHGMLYVNKAIPQIIGYSLFPFPIPDFHSWEYYWVVKSEAPLRNHSFCQKLVFAFLSVHKTA